MLQSLNSPPAIPLIDIVVDDIQSILKTYPDPVLLYPFLRRFVLPHAHVLLVSECRENHCPLCAVLCPERSAHKARHDRPERPLPLCPGAAHPEVA